MLESELSYLLDAHAVQRITSLSRARTYELMKEIPVVRVGTSKLIRAADLEAWIQLHVEEPVQP
jgi:hypothetical protein